MAVNITKAPLLRTLATRGYSQCPQGVPVGGLVDYEIKSSVLPNKIVVAAAENESAISRISIVFRAGARHETPDSLGAVHVLRVCAGLSTRNASQFAITRNIQQVGANLTCATDRETISYTLEGTRPAIEKTLPFLTEVATQQCFRPWEVSDNIPRMRLELATRPPQLRAVDLLHKAAYRSRGLGNSLYIAKHQVGNVSAETLQHFVTSRYTPDRCAVVGLGVDCEDLVKYAQTLCLQGSAQACPTAEYKGGEIRSDKGGDLAHIAIAGPGGALRNAKEALSFAVLQRVLGVGTSIKYNSESNGLFAQALKCPSSPFSVTALNVSYSDSGLFGALITVPAHDAGNALTAIVKVLKSGCVADEDVSRGKNQLKTAVLTALESGTTAIEDMGTQAVLIGSVANADQIATAIGGITTADVNDAAQKVASSNLSIASVGNLICVPFLDDIK